MKKFVDRFINTGQSVLDVGSQCVDGQTMNYRQLMPQGVNYCGLDIEAGINVTLVAHNQYAWPIEDNSMDIVICGQTLEHVEYPWLTMKEIGRVLKPDGKCCIIAPSKIELHRFPIDTYRYNPDGMAALAKWSKLNVLDVYQVTSGVLVDCVAILQKNLISKSVIYYSDNRIDGTGLNNACRKTLTDSGLPIISVTQKPIDLGTNIVVDKRPSGKSLIEQVIIGLENCTADYVYFCEHDCLYHPSHFDITSHVVAYNSNIWRLTPIGYYLHPKFKPVLSACMGPRLRLLEAMRDKLEHWNTKEIQFIAEGHNPETERMSMMYEPGRGGDRSGSRLKCWLPESEFPVLDVRHSDNFTGRGYNRHQAYVNTLPYWGEYKELRKSLNI